MIRYQATKTDTTYSVRRLERTRALLVVTYRDDELGADHPLRGVLAALPHGVVPAAGVATSRPSRGRAVQAEGEGAVASFQIRKLEAIGAYATFSHGHDEYSFSGDRPSVTPARLS